MTALFVMVPPQLLDAGENTIHVRVNATSSGAFLHGLPRVSFGEARALHNEHLASSELGFNAQRIFFAMALVTGIITLFLWLIRRSDRVMFWYSVACLMWGLVSIPRLALRWMDVFEPLIPVLSWFLNYGLVVPVVILCLRTVNLKWPRFEAALWVYLAIEAAFPLWATGGGGQGYLAWDTANTALLLAGVVVVVFHVERPLRWSVILQIAALLLMAALMFFEVMRYLGWVYVDFKAVRHYHVPLMLLAIGAMIFERHVLAVRRTERANLQLEKRVAEKAREIEMNYARVEEARRQQALAKERQRILTDMHDGLGASLIGLLRHARSGGSDCAGIERRIQEALQEIKTAVDALKPSEDDLATVLGNLRYRLDSMIRETGTRLMWKVTELPPVVGLSPSTVFALQRILLEAITNVLKHSGATQISFTAQAQGEDGIRIRIEDDGKGFDPLHPAPGLGLANMRSRAASIGAVLEIRSRPSEGTVVELALPTSLASAVAMSASEKPEPGSPQRARMPAGIVS
ncbi:MAG: sensor histidine kinase [Betaproteobacteria bacterium]